MYKFSDIFTSRQLVALTVFSDLVEEASKQVQNDAMVSHLSHEDDAKIYADALTAYLAIGVSRYANGASTICSWDSGQTKEHIRFTFSRQSLPMTWDYTEGNPFSNSSGNYADNIETWLCKALLFLPRAPKCGTVTQESASKQSTSKDKIVSTDPPYYDNIGYSDLSDFFYVWLRRSLKPVFPKIFATILAPKIEELVANPYRHGNKKKAETFFLDGMTKAINRLVEQAHPEFPVTIYYAFKQSETKKDGRTSTGWETFLEAVIKAGFSISGTWPMRTELGNRIIGSGANVLASSIVLVCRQRLKSAPQNIST